MLSHPHATPATPPVNPLATQRNATWNHHLESASLGTYHYHVINSWVCHPGLVWLLVAQLSCEVVAKCHLNHHRRPRPKHNTYSLTHSKALFSPLLSSLVGPNIRAPEVLSRFLSFLVFALPFLPRALDIYNSLLSE